MERMYPVDYHIHYYMDSCADDEMTLKNIEEAAFAQGLREIGVVKHCSEKLPGGGDFVAWHILKQNEFDDFIHDVRSFAPGARLPIYAGVESELMNEAGDISISGTNYNKIDYIMLSVHYMIEMNALKHVPLLHPRMQRQLLENDTNMQSAMALWKEEVAQVGAARILEGLVNAYSNAIRRNGKILALSHMYDGLYTMRDYQVPCDELSVSTIVEIMEPLMRVMVEYGVLWELVAERIVHPEIVKRANEIGVRFLATADSHSITGGWGNLVDHHRAEMVLDELRLNRGSMRDHLNAQK